MKLVKIIAILFLFNICFSAYTARSQNDEKVNSVKFVFDDYSTKEIGIKLIPEEVDTLKLFRNYFFKTDTSEEKPENNSSSFSINSLDTVIFDISKSYISGNYIEFPVTFHSDDLVYALDFSLKYNNQNVEFDSIINITTGLNYLYFLNPSDSTLRFTSYSLAQMQSDSAVVTLRFSSTSGFVCTNDLNTINVYLNGDQCSSKVTDCDTTSTYIEIKPVNSPVSVFPNPANKFIEIKLSDLYSFQLIDINGNTVLSSKKQNHLSSHQIDVSNLENGLYIIKITTDKNITFEKILLHH